MSRDLSSHCEKHQLAQLDHTSIEEQFSKLSKKINDAALKVCVYIHIFSFF